MKETETPLELVRLWPEMLPNCYEQLDDLWKMKAEGEMWWPDYCELPISAAYTMFVTLGYSDEQAASVAAELTACWTWQRNKVVYCFDSDLANALAEQVEDMEETDVLPVDLLLHLPSPCIYIKAPSLVEVMDGFFAWIEYDTSRKTPELRIQWVSKDYSGSVGQVLHLIPDGTIGDCILDTMKVVQKNLNRPVPLYGMEGANKGLFMAIQLILYLLSNNADIEDEVIPTTIQRSTKKDFTIINSKAGEIDGKLVGIRVGAALRKATRKAEPEQSGLDIQVWPHTRRGHWHHYWTGPMKGERKLILKWTAPTAIHTELGLNDNVISFPEKS